MKENSYDVVNFESSVGHSFEAGKYVGKLLEGSEENWRKAINHTFLKELFFGSVDDDVLRHYLIQDYQFFDAFLSMLGACVAHADNLDSKLRFAKQLGFLSSDEDGYFVKTFELLGVPKEEYLSPKLDKVTQDFQDLMCSAVKSADYAQLLVMLVIAEGLYLDWGSKDLILPPNYIHSEWIELHKGEFFNEWVQFLVDELNRVCEQRGTIEDLKERWNKAVELELAFFDLGYK